MNRIGSKKCPAAVTLLIAMVGIGTAAAATSMAILAAPAASAVLVQTGRVDLPGYGGDLDQFAVDLEGNRLFLAAEDHDTIELFDLKSGKRLKTITGVATPHGLLYLPDANKLIVTQTGSDGMTKVIDGASYKIIGSFTHVRGADSMAYDAPRKRLYVVAGGGNMKEADSYLVELGPYTGENYGETKFDTDKVEAMAIEAQGDKIYVNVTGKNQMAVLDKRTLAVIATWPIKEAQMNAPLAFDEASHRLFVVTRQPARIVVVNADNGASIADFKAPERTDQVIFDKSHRRVYLLGGEGYIGVFQEKDPDHYIELPRAVSSAGAKTGILVPELDRLFVAVSPGDSNATAAVLIFKVGN